MTTRIVATGIAALSTAVTVSALLAGCGSSTSPASSTTPPASGSASSVPMAPAHNQADITFAQSMIPHHAQAVSMSKLAGQHASSAQVKDLAARIEAAQQPEIDQMSGFLRAWNAPVPDANDPGMGAMSGMNHGDMTRNNMPGMMSQQQMQQLSQANGAAFDTLFLQMMIGHHQGAVSMSKTELAEGVNPNTKALAQRIIDAQQREITEMQTMLAHR